MTDIKLLLIHRNTLNLLTVLKKKNELRLIKKMFSTKCVYKSYVLSGFGIKLIY